ncbi:MAG: DsbA family oxidoreductase [Chloroflexota bacterium]|nr:MAG: DsbA family oxidoreductase [Chloroflexota bacterium]
MHIDIYHDTVCPWCRLGWEHLKLALARWQGEPVTVRHRPFFLNPDVPPEGYDFLPYMRQKFAGRMTPEMAFAGPTEAGKRIGVTYRFDLITKMPNTLLSHRLIELSPEAQRERVIEGIYAAYFEHGQDIGQIDVLANIAAEAGLDREAIAAALAGKDAEAEVLAQVRQAQQLGVQGVPLFVLDNLYAISGAHPPETLLNALRQVVENRSPATSGT